MKLAVFDTHAFVKRLTAVGMPEAQAEVLADEQMRLNRGQALADRLVVDTKAEHRPEIVSGFSLEDDLHWTPLTLHSAHRLTTGQRWNRR